MYGTKNKTMIKEAEKFTKYERARILGARALQISMDAPVLLKVDNKLLTNLNFDPLRIAEEELDSGILPISIKRPMPKKKKESLEKVRIKEEEFAREGPQSDEEKLRIEEHETNEAKEDGEIMELASPADEIDEEAAGEGFGSDEGLE